MMRHFLTLLTIMPVLTACCLLPPDPTSMEAQLQAQLARQPSGEITFTSYSFNFLNRYRISHDWAMMRNVDVCSYFSDYLLEFPIHDIRQVRIPPVQNTFKNRTILERGKLLFDYDPYNKNPLQKWDPFTYVLPEKHFSKVTNDFILRFQYVCSSELPEHEITAFFKNWPINDLIGESQKITNSYPRSTFKIRKALD